MTAAWPAVNAYMGRFGIEANSHQELVEQLGILRFGHRPRVGDTVCGGGSIDSPARRNNGEAPGGIQRLAVYGHLAHNSAVQITEYRHEPGCHQGQSP
jgi:hypothetical protein